MDYSMNIHDWVWFILLGGMAGWLASMLVSGVGLGILGDIVVGIVGAVFGAFLANLFGFTAYGFWEVLAVSVLGAVILVAALRMFHPHKRVTDR